MQLTSPEDAFCQSSLGEIIHVVSILFFTILDKKNLQKKYYHYFEIISPWRLQLKKDEFISPKNCFVPSLKSCRLGSGPGEDLLHNYLP